MAAPSIRVSKREMADRGGGGNIHIVIYAKGDIHRKEIKEWIMLECEGEL